MNPIVFFDLETTGVDLSNDKIVQFAGMKVTGFLTSQVQYDRLKFYINPGKEMSQEVIDIHGITNEMVAECPKFKELAPDIARFIEGCDLSGYNIKRFDIPFLAEEMNNAGLPFTLKGRTVIDPFILYKILYPQSLSAAYKHYTNTELQGAHDAMNDVEASFMVFNQMVLKGHVPSDLGELLKFQNNGEEFDSTVDFAGKFIRNKDGVILLNFGKHRGKPVSENLDFVEWMLNKDFTKDTIAWCYELLKSD